MAEKLVEGLNRLDAGTLSQHLDTNFSAVLATQNLNLEIHTPSSIPRHDLDQCFSLVCDNLKSCYENSSWGWHPDQKREELAEPDTRYLIVRDTTDTMRGFLSFQMIAEEDVAIIYCWELQLSPDIRGRGVGKNLMHVMHDIARTNGLEMAMLTVFTANEIACQFYNKLGYEVDESSPKDRILRGRKVRADYAILSRPLSR